MAVIHEESKNDPYIGALVAVGVGIPIPLVAAILTLLGYFWLSSLSHLPPDIIPGMLLPLVVLGLILTIFVWLLLAFLFRPVATARGGKPSDYEVFQQKLDALHAQFEIVKFKADDSYKVEIEEIKSIFDDINDMVGRNGLPWVLRTGYISLWDRINKADEAMIDVLPREQVIESAKYDILSLKGSKVPHNEESIERLNKAISTLSSDSNRFKLSCEQNKDTDLELIITLPMNREPSGSSTTTSTEEQRARSDIRQVKSALHKYTNERWDALVRARNQLMGTALLTSILTYILVVIAVLAVVPAELLEKISVFYLLGAIVGLFGQMLNESRTKDKDIFDMDDYGLKGSRILVVPLLSGLAALVGVLLAALLPDILKAIVDPGSTDFSKISIEKIYDFSTNPLNLIFAAIFGYMPSLLVEILKQQTNKIQSELHSSSPGA